MIDDISNLCFRTTQRLTKQFAPRLYRRISYLRNEGRLRRIARKIIRGRGALVQAGPFKGMKLTPAVAEVVYTPMLVGSYEAELEPIIKAVIARNYNLIVDIGCAHGYYAVGLLLRLPKARCIAFDLDRQARELCRGMADANGASDRIEIRGRCEPEALKSLALIGGFLLCDCEGAELELLDPVSIPGLVGCDILVELHDFLVPGVTQTIVHRFEMTHTIQLVRAAQKESLNYPELSFLNPQERTRAIAEHRPGGMRWAWLRSKPGPAQ